MWADQKEIEKLARRNVIIDAAEKQFIKNDFDGVSLDNIANDLGISKPTIYQYFKNKEALFFAVAQRSFNLMMEIYQEIVEGKSGENSNLEALGDALFTFSRKYPDHYRIIDYARSGALDAARSVEGRAFLEMMDNVMVQMSEFIKISMDAGTIRNDMDPLEIAVFLITASESITHLSPGIKAKLEKRGVSYDQYMEDVIRIMKSGMQGKK